MALAPYFKLYKGHVIAFISILRWKFSFVRKTPIKHIPYSSGNVIESLYGEKKEKKKN